MNSLVSKTARNENANAITSQNLKENHKSNESNVEINNRKGSKNKMLSKDISSSENIMVGITADGRSNDIGPSSPKGKSKVARKLSSKNVMSSKQADQL